MYDTLTYVVDLYCKYRQIHHTWVLWVWGNHKAPVGSHVRPNKIAHRKWAKRGGSKPKARTSVGHHASAIAPVTPWKIFMLNPQSHGGAVGRWYSFTSGWWLGFIRVSCLTFRGVNQLNFFIFLQANMMSLNLPQLESANDLKKKR